MVGLKTFLQKLMMVSLQINNMKPKTLIEKCIHKAFSLTYFMLNKNCVIEEEE